MSEQRYEHLRISLLKENNKKEKYQNFAKEQGLTITELVKVATKEYIDKMNCNK